MSLESSELEQVYEALAKALDNVAEADREMFLCKLSLLMAREMPDAAQVTNMIQAAQNHLETA